MRELQRHALGFQDMLGQGLVEKKLSCLEVLAGILHA